MCSASMAGQDCTPLDSRLPVHDFLVGGSVHAAHNIAVEAAAGGTAEDNIAESADPVDVAADTLDVAAEREGDAFLCKFLRSPRSIAGRSLRDELQAPGRTDPANNSYLF